MFGLARVANAIGVQVNWLQIIYLKGADSIRDSYRDRTSRIVALSKGSIMNSPVIHDGE